ncbi:hypothetical protein RCL1_005752 [Eukaryota sp. TZLM3-RCL]
MPAPYAVRQKQLKQSKRELFRKKKFDKVASSIKSKLPSNTANIRVDDVDSDSDMFTQKPVEVAVEPPIAAPPVTKKKRNLKFDKRGRPTISSQINCIVDKLKKS